MSGDCKANHWQALKWPYDSIVKAYNTIIKKTFPESSYQVKH